MNEIKSGIPHPSALNQLDLHVSKERHGIRNSQLDEVSSSKGGYSENYSSEEGAMQTLEEHSVP
ncbi:hypothetical protein M513_00975 [Trichuris suis]|uniref:Uncharacterized protein n=1 Tax=Trichuris suis TaxID=68888 RepID=A0A085MLW6_9BILA|nr:hypothetical protein M513_00975 [Trichuris suis]